MPLFVCDKCNCIENTALCGYWFREKEWDDDGNVIKEDPKLCSNCDPKFKGHKRFPMEKFDPKKWGYRDKGSDFIEELEYLSIKK